MTSLDFQQMQEKQRELQAMYKDKWPELCPEVGRDKLLWMITEAGEVADIIKKQGDKRIIEDSEVRNHFIEEMCDVLMYFNDIMICYEITPEELAKSYIEKHNTNMDRW